MNRKQCPVCLSAHHERGAFCSNCAPMVGLGEAWLTLIEVGKAALWVAVCAVVVVAIRLVIGG